MELTLNMDEFEVILQKCKTIIFAHRGASGYEYENTMKSFYKAIELGADGLETDAWLLADGNIVLHHDKGVKIDELTKNISKMTLDEIKKVKLSNNEQIPTIDEFFEEFSKLKTVGNNPIVYSIDLQDSSVGLKLAEFFKENTFDEKLTERVILCGDSLVKLRKVREINKEIKIVASNQENAIKPENFIGDTKYNQLKIFGFNISKDSFKEKYKEILDSAGLKCFIWDLHSEQSLNQYLIYKPHAIYSNFPDLALKTRNNLIKKENKIIEN